MYDYLKARVKDVYVKIITGIVRWLLGNVLHLGYTTKKLTKDSTIMLDIVIKEKEKLGNI